MLVIQVFVRVKSDKIADFRLETLENAHNSLKEPGIARFDLYQQQEDPTRFTLIEVYRNQDAPARHKETAHYKKWRDAVADMMAESRTSVKYTNIFPNDKNWQ